MANYPTSLDVLANPTGGQVQGSTTPTHSGHHANANDILEALEAKLGTGASTPSAGTVLRGTGAGASAFGALVNADIDAVAAIALTKLEHVGAGNVLRSNGSLNVAGQIVSADITDGTILGGDLASKTIGSAQIGDNVIGTLQLAAGSVSQAGAVNGSTANPTTTSGTAVLVPEMTITFTSTGGTLIIAFSGGFQHSVLNGTVAVDINVDATVVQRREYNAPVANQTFVFGLCYVVTGIPSGSRTITANWVQAGGTAKAFSTQRTLGFVELKR